jgi:protein-S-isoprenylcysteine O-methyltransferase Ste14
MITASVLQPSPHARRLAAAWFGLQGLCVAGWWLVLVIRPEVRGLFLPKGNAPSSLLAFALPDVVFLVVGSCLAAALIAGRSQWALPLVVLVTGAVDYATLHVLAWAWLSGGGWLGFIAMGPAALVSTVQALLLASEGLRLYRVARAASAWWNVTKTLGQVIAFWSFFLAAVPKFLMAIDPLPRLAFGGQRPLAIVLFCLLSALGLLSGWTMSWRGQGTPLPVDGPRRLVIGGPYAWVRNPMAVSGLGQGVCVGLFLGSWLVVVYALLGSAIWNFLVRPSEEADLEAKFGADFVRYRSQVRCWVPRRQPYRA